MAKHLYLKSDENGGITMSFVVAALIAIITLITPFVAASLYAGKMDARLASQEKEIASLEQQYAIAGPQHAAIIEDMKNTDAENDKRITVMETKLTTIQSDIGEIKGDVKVILRKP
jgi:peptidoglycan hydrolase CwlO-like protein